MLSLFRRLVLTGAAVAPVTYQLNLAEQPSLAHGNECGLVSDLCINPPDIRRVLESSIEGTREMNMYQLLGRLLQQSLMLIIIRRRSCSVLSE